MLACVAFTACAAIAHAGDRFREALSLVPDDVDLCIAVQDARGLRDEPLGQAVESAMRLLGQEAGVGLENWSGFTASLGLPEQDAFNRLLGTFVLVATRDSDGDGSSEWVLRTEVDAEVLADLRASMGAAPRDVVAGRPVFGVENGRFRIAVQRHKPTGAIIHLAPANATGLMYEMLRAGADQPRAVAGPRPGSLFAADVLPTGPVTLRTADAYIYLRTQDLSADDIEALDAPPSLGALAAKSFWVGMAVRARGLRADTTASLGGSLMATLDGEEFRPWPAEWFQALEQDAHLLLLDRTNGDLMTLLFGAVDGSEQGLLPWNLPAEIGVLAAPRIGMLVRDGVGGGLDAAVSIESDDIRALARVVDEAMPALLGESGRSFVGLPAAAVRTAPFPLLGEDDGAARSRLAWNYRVVGHCNEHQETGWWTIGVGAATVSDLGRVMGEGEEPAFRAPNSKAPAEGRPAGGVAVPEIPLVSLGVVRPRAFVSKLAGMGVDLGATGTLLSGIEHWEYQIVRTGTARGLAASSIQFVPAAERAAESDDQQAAPE